MKKYCIVGSGRQGTAAAYDLIKFASPDSILIIDGNKKSLESCAGRIKSLTGYNVECVLLDINEKDSLVSALHEVDIFLSAVPYPFNLYLTDVAIESKTSMVDLGAVSYTHLTLPTKA